MTKIRQLFGKNLWRANHPLQDERFWSSALRVERVFVLAWRSFWADECMLRATALAYTTLLTLVPLLAVAFSLFTAFPGLQDIYRQFRDIIYRYLAAGATESVITALDRFIENVHSGALAGIGTAALFVAVFFMLNTIEVSFNRIWDVGTQRRIFDRFVYYLAIVIIGPLFLGISLKTFFTAVVTEFSALPLGEQTHLALFRNIGLPLVASCAACTVLYVAIPNTKVYWSAGIAGGIVGGTLFELAKRAYTLYATRAINYSAIYGTLGSIPIFLIWIYVIWLVVLLGSEFAYAWQNVDVHRRERAHRDISQSRREWLAVSICVQAARDFFEGKPGPSALQISDRYDIPLHRARELTDQLRARGILAESDRGFLPARDPAQITLAQVVATVRSGPNGESALGIVPRSGDEFVTKTLAALEQITKREYGKISIADLVHHESSETSKALRASLAGGPAPGP